MRAKQRPINRVRLPPVVLIIRWRRGVGGGEWGGGWSGVQPRMRMTAMATKAVNDYLPRSTRRQRGSEKRHRLWRSEAHRPQWRPCCRGWISWTVTRRKSAPPTQLRAQLGTGRSPPINVDCLQVFGGRVQELCQSRSGRPGLASLINLRLLWT